MDAGEALELLQFMPHAAAQPVAKLIRSAIANAEENFGIPREDLYVARIMADDGPGVMPGKGWRRLWWTWSLAADPQTFCAHHIGAGGTGSWWRIMSRNELVRIKEG
jgi:hypothetical protein